MTTVRFKQVGVGIGGPAPVYAKQGDSGVDLRSFNTGYLWAGETRVFMVGLAIELPDGYEAQIRPRSSFSAKGVLCHFGTIDSGFRGELGVTLTNITNCAGAHRVPRAHRAARCGAVPASPVGAHRRVVAQRARHGWLGKHREAVSMSINQHTPVPEERFVAVRNLLVAGHSVNDTAERLGLTHGQVRHAERAVMRRAGVKRRGELMRAHGNTEPAVPHANRTPLDVQRTIVSRRKAGERLESLALDYGLSPSGVSRICKRWRDECMRQDERARMARVTEQAYCDARAEERGAAE